MKQGNEVVRSYHQQGRDGLRAMKGGFCPSREELELEKQRFLANGGVIKKLIIGKDSIPNVWGDFVKSKAKSR
jgi:hypothetical protein